MDRTETHFTLADGRRLAYRDDGDHDAPAIVFNPGFMACRLTGRPAGGVRIITADRPGIGLSDPKPDRTVAEWPDDVSAHSATVRSRFGSGSPVPGDRESTRLKSSHRWRPLAGFSLEKNKR